MEITSIDNVYEQDGIANLEMMLMGLNLAHARDVKVDPTCKDQTLIIGIVPEYTQDGRLDRLNVVTVKRSDALAMDDLARLLSDAGWPIIQKRRDDEAAAIAELEANPPTLMPGPASDKVQTLAQSIDKEAKP